MYAWLKTSTVKPGARYRGGGGGGEGGGGGVGAGIEDAAYENIDGGAVGMEGVTVPLGADICGGRTRC
jgi:hypothetical protein